MKHKLLKLTTLTFLTAFAANASATRWFEIELIAFEQKPTPELREDFKLERKPIQARKTLDMIETGLNNQGQIQCLAGEQQFDPRELSQQIVSTSSSWQCDDDRNYLEKMESLPLAPFAEPQEHMDSMYLLAEEQFQFESVLNKLKRKGLDPILHTGWRFPEMSSRRAPSIEIIAGQKIAKPTSYKAINEISNDGYISLLDKPVQHQAINDEFKWQVEGLMKIHVRHYLFVTTDLDINFIDNEGELQQARMSQYTRVYSGDIHYLDHPRLGIIFQIRKYKH